MVFEHEMKKVRVLIAKMKKAPLKGEQGSCRHLFLRFPKFCLAKTAAPEKKGLPKAQIMHVEEQEKAPSENWNLSALHAHYCCVNQKHPAFVHLAQLLVHESPLNEERVFSWKFKEYVLAAKRLDSFVKERLENPEIQKRVFSEVKEKPQEKEEPWQEYPVNTRGSLFELTGLKNP